jgi:hypothetical protein
MSDDQVFRTNYMQGMNKFNSARTRAFWKEMLNHLRGKSAELLSFEDIKQRLRLREESYRGLHNVPLDQIVGSVGRYREFTRDFLPKRGNMQERWSRVYAQATGMAGLPPIELYKVGDAYFVRDGNHRVSVAQQLKAKTIEAHVTELPTAVDLHAGMSAKDLDDATAYVAFLEETNLDSTRPHHVPLELSERGRYADLLGHIYMHKSILEHMAGREIDSQEAALHWYDTVFRPAITLIRKYNAMDALGVRTEADLYLWIVDHLLDVREEFGDDAPSRKVSDALVDFLKERQINVPESLEREDDQSMILSQTQMMRAIDEIATREAEDDDDEQD